MKFFHSFFFLLIFLEITLAQRRTQSNSDGQAADQSKPLGRGRSRFTATPEYSKIEEENSTQGKTSRKQVPRRRIDNLSPERTHSHHPSNNQYYEVEESIEEVPPEPFRRNSKPSSRVLTETRFRAFDTSNLNNGPKYQSISESGPSTVKYQPPTITRVSSSTEINVDDLFKSIGNSFSQTDENSPIYTPPKEIKTDPIDPVTKSQDLFSSEELDEIKSDNEVGRNVGKTASSSTTEATKTTESARRRGGNRVRGNIPSRASDASPNNSTQRSRPVRTRATRKPQEEGQTSTVASRAVLRSARRKVEATTGAASIILPRRVASSTPPTEEKRKVEATTGAASTILPRRVPPSGFTPEESLTPRSRPGRRTDAKVATEATTPSGRGRSGRRLAEIKDSTTEGAKKRTAGHRFQARTALNDKTESTTTGRKNRGRGFTLDESKLEVLPLFESDAKLINEIPIVKTRKVYRQKPDIDTLETSATTNNIVVRKLPDVTTETAKNVRVSSRESVSVETRTESQRKRKVYKKPIPSRPVKETKKESVVVSEVTEVTSRRTIGRRPVTTAKINIEEKLKEKIGSRARKVVNAKPKKLTSSEEDISDSDNYPPEFKALLNSKKSGESRTPSASGESKTNRNIISSTSTSLPRVTSSTSTTTESAKSVDDLENDIIPKVVATTPLAKRYTSTTSKPQKEVKELPRRPNLTRKPFGRSTSTSTTTTPQPNGDGKFHAKFVSTNKNEATPKPKVVPKPPRGLYSSRKTKEGEKPVEGGLKTAVRNGKKLPDNGHVMNHLNNSTAKKPSRSYSARYRTRAVSRSSTASPAYVPTIPSIRHPTTPLVRVKHEEENDFGLEVISFDEPSNTVPSAALINGEYLSTARTIHLESLDQKTTEKPVSIIESIINSIASISTTADPNKATTASTTEEPTKASAILKLATKKNIPNTKNVSEASLNLVTSEKPTTVIQRILSSLSAIQAENKTNIQSSSTETNNSNQQVGSTFNTLSNEATTPMSLVEQSTVSTIAPSVTTTINPLNVFDEITNEEVLQKDTIGKLLDLLNSWTTTTLNPPTAAYTDLVYVTPKVYYTSPRSNFIDSGPRDFQSSTLSQLFTSAPNNAIKSRKTEVEDVQSVYTSVPLYSSTYSSKSSTTPPEEATVFTSALPSTIASSSTEDPSSTYNYYDVTSLKSFSEPSTTTFSSSTLPISTESSTSFELTTPSTSTESLSSTTESYSSSSTTSNEIISSTVENEIASSTVENEGTETVFNFPSTFPTLPWFKVSPESVSVFNANDLLLSNAITDDPWGTVTISSSKNALLSTTPMTDSTETPMNSSINNTTNSTIVNRSNTNSSIIVNKSNDTMINGSLPSMSSLNVTSRDVVSNNKTNVETTTPLNPDYFIFAVLPNNTILRKRPRTFVNKDAPYVIVGVYPNNTIVERYPNGTVVPMEPVIRVGDNMLPIFDTRNSFDDSNVKRNDTNITTTLSPSSTESTTIISSTSTDSTTTIPSTSEASKSTLPSIVSLLNGKTVKALNTILNNDSKIEENEIQSNRIGKVLNLPTTTEATTTVKAKPLTTKMPTAFRTTTSFPSTTFLPALLSTLFPSINFGLPSTTYKPKISKTETTTTFKPTPPTTMETITAASTENYFFTTSDPGTTFKTSKVNPRGRNGYWDNEISSTFSPTTRTASTTTKRSIDDLQYTTSNTISLTTRKSQRSRGTSTLPTTTVAEEITTTRKPRRARVQTTTPTTTTEEPETTTTRKPRKTTTTTVEPTTIVVPEIAISNEVQLFTQEPLTTIKPKKKKLTEQQKKDLETLAQLEKEQAAILKQLSFLTNLNLNPSASGGRNNLASRVVDLAMQRGQKKTTDAPEHTTRNPKKVKYENLSVEELIKELNLDVSTSASTETTTKKPKTTTPSIEELLKQFNAETTEEPSTTKRPKKPKTTTLSIEEILKQINFETTETPSTTKRPKKPKTTTPSIEELLKQYTTEEPSTTRRPRKPKTTTESVNDLLLRQVNEQTTEVVKGTTPDIEELLKQLQGGGVSPSPDSSYGTSREALLAALLKERGIGPTTPKSLVNDIRHAGILTDTLPEDLPVTKRARTTQRPPGRLFQRLGWLFNAIAGPLPQPTTTRRPKAKKKKPKTTTLSPEEEELLTNEPTHITPVVTNIPKNTNSLSQSEIKKLIKQLEAVQRDPSAAKDLDLSSIKGLSNLNGVEVITSGNNGATRRSTTTTTTTRKPRDRSRGRSIRTSTVVPSTVSNSVYDDEVDESVEVTTPKQKTALPPVKLRPVKGVDDETRDPFIRGNLISAAVNVTRAISSFLGTALQGAATSFRSLLGQGSSYIQGS